MTNKKNNLLLHLLSTISLFILNPQFIYATPNPPRLCQITNIIEQLIKISLAAGGLVAFIMMIFGAVSWITAGADDKKLSQAQSTITWGVIGLVLLVGSYFILALIGNFTGVTLTEIKFPWIGPGSPPSECL